MAYQEFTIEGRNAVIEAYRSGKPIDKIFILDGCQDGPIMTIKREAKKHDTLVKFVPKERLDQMSETGKHQGVIAYAAAYEYAEVEDILRAAEEKGEAPFLVIADGVEDPHNLGAIIRCAEGAGVHGLIISKRHSAPVTPVVVKSSAGAIQHLPIAKVVNIASTIDDLQKKGVWIYGAEAEGTSLYEADLTGAAAFVVGSEGNGISRLVKEKCDFLVKIPMIGEIESLNASVAAGVLIYEALRQRS